MQHVRNLVTRQRRGASTPDSPQYVHADGCQLRTPDGQPLVLRGVNLGGWLVQEKWMCGISDNTDAAAGRFAFETLRERFGAEKARELVATWRDSWITEADFEAIAALGANCVRIPFSWRDVEPAGEARLKTACISTRR